MSCMILVKLFNISVFLRLGLLELIRVLVPVIGWGAKRVHMHKALGMSLTPGKTQGLRGTITM